MGLTIKKMKKSSLAIFLILTSTLMFIPVNKTKSIDYFFTIKGIYADYNEMSAVASQYKDQLAKIGINLELEGLDIFGYIDQKYHIHDYDLFFGLVDNRDYVDDVNSSVGYDITLDYNSTLGTGKNQWYLDTFDAKFPPDTIERKQFYHEWQDYLMDEIVPLIPLLASSSKSACWAYIHGYNSSLGVIQSLGHISKGGITYPLNTSELLLADSYGGSINPIKYFSSYLKYTQQAIFDPLVWSDGYHDYWPHIATNWVHINNTHVRFTIREDIKWANDPDDLFPSEVLDIEDVYFSLYCYKNVSPDRHYYRYMKHFEIINETTIDVYFDGDQNTPENEYYSDYLKLMSEVSIVPEHYLNQTQLGDGVTPDDSHASWLNFSSEAFGTGPYQIDSYVDDDYRDLALFENSWRLDSDLLLDSTLNWEERFGNNYTIKKIRILDIVAIQSQIDNLLTKHIDLIEDLPSAYFYSQIPTETGIGLDDFIYVGGVDVIFNLREDRPIIGNRNTCPNDENITQGLAVRKAIAYASNAEALDRIIFDGYNTRTYYPIPLGMTTWCSPTITKYHYNLVQAVYYMGLLGYDIEDLYSTSEIIGIPFLVTFIGIQFICLVIVFIRNKIKKRKNLSMSLFSNFSYNKKYQN